MPKPPTRQTPRLGRCVALDGMGHRCRKQATMRERYHGDQEFYGYLTDRANVGWVVAAFCDVHGQSPASRTKGKP